MTFPTITWSAGTPVTTMQTAHNFTAPATLVAGDGILGLFVGSQVGADETYTITDPSGFTSLRERQWSVAGQNRQNFGAFIKVSDGTEDGSSIAFTTSAAVTGVLYWGRIAAGTWGGTVSDVVFSTHVEAEAANIDPPDLTSGFGAVDTTYGAIYTAEDSDFGVVTVPSGYTSAGATTIADGTEDAVLAVATKNVAAASENPGAWTAASEKLGAFTFAIKGSTDTNLYPTGQTFNNGWTDEAGGSTDLHLVVDETGAAGTDYIRTPTNSSVRVTFDITNMPSDFQAMTSLSVEIRHSRGTVEGGSAGAGDDTKEVYAYITDSTAAVQLAGGSSTLAQGQLVNTSTQGYVPETDTQAFTYVNTTATKTQWDGALLNLEGDHAASGGDDLHRIWVDYIRLVSVVYSAAVPPPTIYQKQGKPVWLVHLNR